MELRNISNDDLALYEAIHCDPRMMEHLGGPLPKEGLAEKLEHDVAATASGELWMLKIIPDEAAGTAAGTGCIWEHVWEGRTINEIGWMVSFLRSRVEEWAARRYVRSSTRLGRKTDGTPSTRSPRSPTISRTRCVRRWGSRISVSASSSSATGSFSATTGNST